MSDPVLAPLLAAARGAPVREPIDGPTIAAAAAAGMAGLLGAAATDPPRELQLLTAAIEARALAAVDELARIAAAFHHATIPLLGLKGPLVSQQLYGSAGLRLSADIDVIVDEPDAPRAESLLAELGYRDAAAMTQAQRATKRRYHSGSALVNEQRVTVVDLHWRFGHIQFPLALPFADAWSRRAEVRIGRHVLPTLGTSDLVVFTCSHAAKHWWQPLEALAQIHALAGAPSVQWAEVEAIAVASRAARQVGLSFRLAQEVLGSPLPPLPRCLAASAPVYPALRARFHERPQADAAGRDLFLVLDRRRDALAAAAAAVFVPTHADWEALAVPTPLYWLVRPLRLALVRLRRAKRSAGVRAG